ncbi:MAG: tRNA pseudouridine(55) synthase TruB [Cyclobacteriaceae bacterium]|nr:tRNA pseudouridine(55) synthase TruB [Cyclobacteriaceae bacterium]UYN88240.1 MAG: tRNA pseudouridine(55) synthase TruB [Cyclobacteriaceae bacterium]
METPPDTHDRILLINKPLRWTSFDVVNKLRYILKMKKIGHAGTLDPLATGLLIICTGKMTKRIEEFMGLEKEYTGTLVLGQTTPSHDLETPVSEAKEIGHITLADVQQHAKKFTGKLTQIPPAHSAIKIGGKRAYALARKGKEPELKPREVEVAEFEIIAYQQPAVTFRIVCSKGTYIRSLVRDLGNSLGVGAYLSQLCRTRIGPYKLSDSVGVEEVNP